MGGPKPAMMVGGLQPAGDGAGRPMLAHVLAAAAAAGLPPLLVVGAHRAAVLAAAGPVPAVHAADHGLGLAHSLRAGLAAVPSEWTGLLVLLADMPFVAPATLRLLAAALQQGVPAVVPVHGGRRGNPAGFARAAFPALAGLSGDRGAAGLLDGLGVVEVAVDDPGIHRDIDRPEDF